MMVTRKYSYLLVLLLLVLLVPVFLQLTFFGQFRYQKNFKIHHVRVDKISKALWDSDFKIMSLVLQKQLPNLLKNCHNIENIKGITIFVPSDHKIYHYQMKYDRMFIGLEYQIMTSKLDKKSFLENPLSDIELASCNQYLNVRLSKFPYAQKLKWDIYNDEFVAVHGVEEFFHDNYEKVIPIKSWLPVKTQAPSFEDLEALSKIRFHCGCTNATDHTDSF